MALQQQVHSFREPDAERLGARPFPCDFHVHAPTDWDEDLGSKAIEAYLVEDYLPRVYAAGREVIGVPQHTPIAGAGGAGLVRDLARKLRSGGQQNIPVVFPGYELTSSDQLQVILLADPDEPNLQDLDGTVRILLELGKAASINKLSNYSARLGWIV